MKPVLVLGLGNRLMMDDGIGVAVVEALAEQCPADRLVRWAVGETDFEYCLSLITPGEYLVVVDAARTGGQPGAVSVRALGQLAVSRYGLSQHDSHFLDLLDRTGRSGQGVLIGIEPSRVQFGLGLSPELQVRFPAILRAVEAAVRQIYKSQWR